jgi:hypothetical protein
MVEGRESKALGCLQKIANLGGEGGGGGVFFFFFWGGGVLKGKKCYFKPFFLVLGVVWEKIWVLCYIF